MRALVGSHGSLPRKSICFTLGNSKGRGMVVPDAAIATVDEDNKGPTRFVIEEEPDDPWIGHESVPLGCIPASRSTDSLNSVAADQTVAFDGVPQSADNVAVLGVFRHLTLVWGTFEILEIWSGITGKLILIRMESFFTGQSDGIVLTRD